MILYTFLKTLVRVGFLGRIPRADIIILKLNLSRSSIFWSVGLYWMGNSIIISIQVYGDSSTIVLPNHFDSDVCQIITSSSNSTNNSTNYLLFILLATLLFLFRIALYLLISLMYSSSFIFFSFWPFILYDFNIKNCKNLI